MIQKYLSQNSLIERILTKEDILLLSKKEKINIMMGQTFDSGQPIDMIKYALFIMGLEDSLKDDSEVVSTWLIADHFMTSINEDKKIKEAKIQASNRINYLERLNKVYNGKIKVVLSSDLSKTPKYQENLRKLKKIFLLEKRF